MGAEEEFFDQEAGEDGGVVPDDAVFFQEIGSKQVNIPVEDLFAVEGNRFGAFGEVTRSDAGGDRFAIGDDSFNDAAGNVFLDGADMVAERVAGGFAWLGHEVGNVNAWSFRTDDGVSDLWDKQVGDDAGVERTGTHKDEVSLLDGFDSRRKRADAARGQLNFANGNLAARNAGFTLHALAVGERGDKVDVGEGGRKDTAANGQDFAGLSNCFGKVTGHLSKGRKKEIAEIVSTESASGTETILEEAAQQGFVLGERNHAVADVSWRKHAVFAAKAAGAAAIIGDRYDRGEVGDGPLLGRIWIAAVDDVFLQTAEQRGETGATPKSDDMKASERFSLQAGIFHERLKSETPGRDGERHLA